MGQRAQERWEFEKIRGSEDRNQTKEKTREGTIEMKKKPFIIALVMTLAILMMSRALPAADAIEGLLPAPGFAGGWALDDRIATYTADNLYRYINGEAELYLPYGFQSLGSALYVKTDGQKMSLVADLYKMGSPLDAFGIYSNYRRTDGETAKVGAESFFNDTQLMFYKDRYFVQLSVSGDKTPDRHAFFACAEAVAQKLPGNNTRPKELQLLNIPAVTRGTERYIPQSLLGYAFFGNGLTAEAIVDGNRTKVFVIIRESAPAAAQVLASYTTYLSDGGSEFSLTGDKNNATLMAYDPLYKGTIVRQAGRHLFGVTNLKDPLRGIPLIEGLQSLVTTR